MRTGTAVLVRVTQGFHWLPLAHRIAHRRLCATSCAMGKLIALITIAHSVNGEQPKRARKVDSKGSTPQFLCK